MIHPIVSAAREQLGVKYRHQARAPGVALDCVGLLAFACEKALIPFKDERHYPATAYNGKLETAMDGQPGFNRVYGDPVAGDVVLISWNRCDCQHIGIITNQGEQLGIIHTYSKVGKVTETAYRGHLRSITHRIYRVIN